MTKDTLLKAVATIGILIYLAIPFGYFYYGSGCVGTRMLPVHFRETVPAQLMEMFVRWYAVAGSATEC